MKTITNFLLASVLVLLSISATAESLPQPCPSDLLMGEWVSEYPIHDRGFEIYTSFNFTEDTMTLTATCQFHYPPAELTVSVEPRVRYQDNNIYIQETHNGQVNDGYRYCTASVQPAIWQFYFDGTGKAILFAPAPYGAQFKLVRPEPKLSILK